MTADPHPCLHCRETCSCASPEDCRHDCDPVEQDETASHGESCVCSKCEGEHDEERVGKAMDEAWGNNNEAGWLPEWRRGE